MAIHSNSPSIAPRLGIDRVVFLITEILRPPELDSCPVEQCTMCFRVMPGLLLDAHDQRIVCPMMIGKRSALSADAQLFQVAQEAENPHCGLSMFAKLTRISDYQTMVPEQLHAHLPASLVEKLFPSEFAVLSGGGYTFTEQTPIQVRFQLPTGYPLPVVCPGKIVRISLNLYSHTGALAPNGQPLLVNSRSRPTRIHLPPAGFKPCADDYYQLRGCNTDLPVTSQLPAKYEDWTDALDPNAALLARMGCRG